MKIIIFFSALLLITSNLQGRENLSNKIQKVDSLLTVTSTEIFNVNPIAAVESATKALVLSREAHYSKGKAKSCFYIGQVIVYLGNYEKSLEYLQLAELEEYTAKDVTLKSEISRVKGQVYSYLGLKNASFREFQRAHDYAIRIKDEKERIRFISLSYENMGLAYSLIKNDPDSSFYYMQKNLALLADTDEDNTFRNKINLYTMFGNYYRNSEQYDSATVWYNKAQSLIKKYNYPYSSWLLVHWGNLHLMKGDVDAALSCLMKGLESAINTNLKTELPTFYQKIAAIYTDEGVEDSARYYKDKYMEISDELTLSKNEATEKAMQILMDEEHRYVRKNLRQTVIVTVAFIIIYFIVTYRIWTRWRRKKRRMLAAKEKEVSELKCKLGDSFEEVIKLAKENDSTFLSRFTMVYPEFTKNLLNAHPHLIESELWLCAMVFLNFSSKEIAQYAFITHRSVQTRKSRLRKKLGISPDVELYHYIHSFA